MQNEYKNININVNFLFINLKKDCFGAARY